MLKKKLAMAAIAALGFAAVPAMSAVEYIEVQSAPPALQVETVPAPQSGQVWIPGYRNYANGSYTWVTGHFEPARQGYVYVAPAYEQRDGRWRMYAGRWESEEEHGGARNRMRAAKDKVKNKVKDKLNGKDDD